MKATYVSTLADEAEVIVDAGSVDDIRTLVGQVRFESQTSAKSDEGGVPAISIVGSAATLTVAPVDQKIILFYATADVSMAYTSTDPSNTDSDDVTVWFSYGGSASELPARCAVHEEVAMAAVSQFLSDSSSLPNVPGLDWERDWD